MIDITTLDLNKPTKVPAIGRQDAIVVIVGEAPGKDEDIHGAPFVGESGKLLYATLCKVGIIEPGDVWAKRRHNPSPRQMLKLWRESGIFLTNVVDERPPNNKIEALCASKADVGGKDYPLPPLRPGKYLRPEYLHNLDRLREELLTVKPNLVVALGNTALWALTGQNKITSYRGTVLESTMVPGLKVLPTFHPAAILRGWGNHPVFLADFMKASHEQHSPDISFPRRLIWIEPTWEDLPEWHAKIMAQPELAVDIETSNGQITCIGFSTETEAWVFPFVDQRKPGYSYWPTAREERAAWEVVYDICTSNVPKVLQNGLYDVQWTIRKANMPMRNFLHDTLLMHHVLHPELPRSLEFMGSIYTNSPAWKILRTGHSFKRDD